MLFSIGFLFFMAAPKAQDPIVARQFFQLKNFAGAKESIDSFVQINSNNAAGWLLKACIDNEISKDHNLNSLVADSRMDAFLALQKGAQLNLPYINEQLKAANYQLPFEIYDGLTNEGLAYYNAGVERNDKNSFNEALNKFKTAAQVSRFIYNNRWGLTATDTSNLYYAAKAAIGAGKEDDAFLFAKKIADAGITKCIAGSAFEDIYQWLAFYYKMQKDGDNLLKYSELAMLKFPSSVYFYLVLIDWERQQQHYTRLFALYEQLFKKQSVNPSFRLAYYNDLFNYLYHSKTAADYRPSYADKLKQGLLHYIKTNPSSADARLLLAKLYINQAGEKGREVLMRSTTDPKVINSYTSLQINLLQQSNHCLNEIITALCRANVNSCKEARQLFKQNLQHISIIKYTAGLNKKG